MTELQTVSILDIMKRGGYEASLITTYNATLPYYEEVVLRRLVAAGARHNVVMMDATQCGQSWTSDAARPRLAGHSYTLVPMRASSAFHPKLCLLLGSKRAAILLGSHNLTLSGFGFNHEVTNWVEVEGPKDAGGIAVLADAWALVKTWLGQQQANLPASVIESALALGEYVHPLTQTVKPSGSSGVLGQSATDASLWAQLLKWAPREASRILVVGAFFDNRFEFLRSLEREWPLAEVVVAIDPETVQLGRDVQGLRSRFVDARTVWVDPTISYLHAKAILFEGQGHATLVAGSANPSWPAWFNDGGTGNTEAVFVQTGDAAATAARAMLLSECFARAAVEPATLRQAIERSRTEVESKDPDADPVCMGVADPEHEAIWLQLPGGRRYERAVAFGADDQQQWPGSVQTDANGRTLLKVDRPVDAVRSAVLSPADGGRGLRVIVHHPAVLAGLSQTKRQVAIRDALGALESGDGDVARLIAAVEKVIFSDDVNREVRRISAGGASGSTKESSPDRPNTLGVHVADMPSHRKKVRLLKSGDLAYLLDVLIRRLGLDLPQRAPAADTMGRTEEEAIGSDDEVAGQASASVGASAGLTDEEIARIVASKSRTLIRRMAKQLELAARDRSRGEAAVVQLVAVLGVVRELRRLRHAPRWRGRPGLVDERDRRDLLASAMSALFGHQSLLLPKLLEDAQDEIEEVSQLRALLLWLAWDLGEEMTDHISAMSERDDRKKGVEANAVLYELLPAVVAHDADTKELERSMLMTSLPTSEEGARLSKWLTRHVGIGRKVIESEASGGDKRFELRVGALAHVPRSAPPRRRVVAALSQVEVVFWEFDGERTFDRRLAAMS